MGLSCLGELCMEVRGVDFIRRIPGSPGKVLSKGHMRVIPLAPQWGVQEGDADWEACRR